MKSAKKTDTISHSGQVNCLQLSRSNSSLLVTGGEDRAVNIWEIGRIKSKSLTRLCGHQSSVESVAFNSTNEHVASGGAGGSVKLWDVEKAQVSRSFAGHRSGVISVEFHPMKNDFIASGSSDTNVRVWDLRRKICHQTFKGHAKGACCLAFSPDGKWIASGSEDGEVKLWDLRTGNLLQNFGDHMGRISGIKYHPKECMLATSSTDRTVRLWDLDTFYPIDVLGPENNPIRSLAFTPDGDSLLAAVSMGIRLWKWEPARREACVDISWSQVHDIVVDGPKNRIVGCSINKSRVAVHHIDLDATTAKPEGSSNSVSGEQMSTAYSSKSSQSSYRRDYFRRHRVVKCLPGEQGRNVKTGDSLHPLDSEVDTPQRVYQPEDTLRTARIQSREVDPPKSSRTRSPLSCRNVPVMSPYNAPFLTSRSTSRHRVYGGLAPAESDRISRTEDPAYSARTVQTASYSHQYLDGNPVDDLTTRSTLTATQSCGPPLRTKPDNSLLNRTFSDWRSNSTSRDHSSRVDNSFYGAHSQQASDTDEEAALSDILGKRDMMTSILASRLTCLQVVKAFWARGDLRGALLAMQRSSDPSVASEFLQIINSKAGVLDLEVIPDISPSLKLLLLSDQSKYWTIALRILSTLLHSFGDLIRNVTNRSGNTTLGVDLSFDQRRLKCLAAKSSLEDLCPGLQLRSQQNGTVGRQAEELHLRLAEL